MDSPNVQYDFDQAIGFHQAGQLAQAQQHYRLVLAENPQHVDATYNLSLIALQMGKNAEAVELLRRAIAQRPDFAQAWCKLSLALRNLGLPHEAIAACEKAITINPNYAEAHLNLGNALHDAGRLDDAANSLNQAIALNPNEPIVHFNLANLRSTQGRLDEAIAAYRRVIELRPDYVKAYNNLGIVLTRQGRLDEAISAYHQAIAIQPDEADSHFNLGSALSDLGRLDEAIAAYRRAIELKPDYLEAHSNLGGALKQIGRFDEAIAAYRLAIAANPNSASAYFNLGVAFSDMGQLDDAIAAYCHAIACRPDYAQAYYNLAVAQIEAGQEEGIASFQQAIAIQPEYADAYINLGNALKARGQLDDAIAAYRKAMKIDPANAAHDSNFVLILHYHPDYDAQAIARELRRWDLQHAQPLRRFIAPHANDRDPERRLRIGYVSPDFKGHVIGRYVLPLLKQHDRRQVEIFCYSNVEKPDHATAEFTRLADHWRDISSVSDEQATRQIRADAIDILVDLASHTAANRLLIFAHKPAPVQVTWLGYPSSTGMNTIDYRLSAPYLDPPGADESIFSEKIVRLPDTYWCFDPLDCREVQVNPLPALERGFVTFGCLNNFCKINDGVIAAWAQVMRQVENSRLLVLAAEGSHRQRLCDRFAREGIDSTRIEFVPRSPRDRYLRFYHRIDIGLDTFPYNGHTTSLDSFWMGVPVVTRVGETGVSRAGWSQLANLSLTELAAQTTEQFVQIAVQLAADLPRLERLRTTLRPRMERSPLMDAAKFARNIEAAYRQMWQRWCSGST